jgi:transcription antitermination factor NusG
MVSENFDAGAASRWFAVRVKSNFEKTVGYALHSKGFQGFVPTYRCRSRRSDRVQTIELPLFPGYVFCRIVQPRDGLKVLTTPGVLHFVGIGRTPIAIEDTEMAAVETAVHSGFPTEPGEYLREGQLVRFDDGPLAGMEGILIETRKQCRVVASVTLLKRSVAVELEREWLTPLGGDRRPINMKWRP